MKVGITCYPTYGGSGIVANCCALAILLRVDRENRQMMKGYSL